VDENRWAAAWADALSTAADVPVHAVGASATNGRAPVGDVPRLNVRVGGG